MNTASPITAPLPSLAPMYQEAAAFGDGLMHGFSRYYQEYATALPTPKDVHAIVQATNTGMQPGPWKAGRVIGWYHAMQQTGDVHLLPRSLQHALACYAIRVTFLQRRGGIYA